MRLENGGHRHTTINKRWNTDGNHKKRNGIQLLDLVSFCTFYWKNVQFLPWKGRQLDDDHVRSIMKTRKYNLSVDLPPSMAMSSILQEHNPTGNAITQLGRVDFPYLPFAYSELPLHSIFNPLNHAVAFFGKFWKTPFYLSRSHRKLLQDRKIFNYQQTGIVHGVIGERRGGRAIRVMWLSNAPHIIK